MICFTISAQQRDTNTKQWSSGMLSWEDFQDTTNIKGVSSILKTNLGIDIEKTKEGNTKTIHGHMLISIDLNPE